MNEIEKRLKAIEDTVRRMEKAGTLAKFYEDIPELSSEEYIKLPIPDIEDGFDRIHSRCLYSMAECAHEAEKWLAKAKYYSTYVFDTYKDYKSREKDIKNPVILKFIKDYENETKN